ncbi:MAG: protein kinase [Alistipes sp.]|nr:protein kinase [Candidatus Alistipes equi]
MNDGTVVAPQGTALALEESITSPQGTALALEETVASPQGTALVSGVSLDDTSNRSSEKLINSADFQGKLIGSGTEAEIFLVTYNGQPTVMKLFKKGFSPNKKVLPYLRRIKKSASVVKVLQTGIRDGREYELMPYFKNGSVANFDLRGNADAILGIVLQMAITLDSIHAAGIVHKDVKPANILIEDSNLWTCYLCDFGIADLLNGGRAVTKQSRTPIYAAPEIYDPKKAVARIDGQDMFEITPAADFYALGMTALSLWLGENEIRDMEQEMAFLKLSGKLKAPSDMPSPLKEIVNGLLERYPSRRFRLKNIEKLFGDETSGPFIMRLYLNPLCDISLNGNPTSPDYLGSSQKMGHFINEIYKNYVLDNYPLPLEDVDLCSCILISFQEYENSYMERFFQGKCGHYDNLDRWMRYCTDWTTQDNERKAGPKDDETRFEISIMKTIAGFGHVPEYTFEDTGETIRSIKELDEVRANRKAALEKGLKGWLAVQYHENPSADLSKKYTYEHLLKDYLEKIGEIDSEDVEYELFSTASQAVVELYESQVQAIKKLRRCTMIQTLLGIIFIILPLLIVLLAAGTMLKILAGIILVMSFLKVFFYRNSNSVKLSSLKVADEEQSLVEPLYFAFSNEDNFDSSLNEQLSEDDIISWTRFVQRRRSRLLLYILITFFFFIVAAYVDTENDDSARSKVKTEKQIEKNGKVH